MKPALQRSAKSGRQAFADAADEPSAIPTHLQMKNMPTGWRAVTYSAAVQAASNTPSDAATNASTSWTPFVANAVILFVATASAGLIAARPDLSYFALDANTASLQRAKFPQGAGSLVTSSEAAGALMLGLAIVTLMYMLSAQSQLPKQHKQVGRLLLLTFLIGSATAIARLVFSIPTPLICTSSTRGCVFTTAPAIAVMNVVVICLVRAQALPVGDEEDLRHAVSPAVLRFIRVARVLMPMIGTVYAICLCIGVFLWGTSPIMTVLQMLCAVSWWIAIFGSLFVADTVMLFRHLREQCTWPSRSNWCCSEKATGDDTTILSLRLARWAAFGLSAVIMMVTLIWSRISAVESAGCPGFILDGSLRPPPGMRWPQGIANTTDGADRISSTLNNVDGLWFAAALVATAAVSIFIITSQMHLARARANESLAAAQRLRAITRYISHEARSPLGGAILSLALIDDSIDEQDFEASKVLVGDLHVSLEAAKRHLDDLLLFEKVTASGRTTGRLTGAWGWDECGVKTLRRLIASLKGACRAEGIGLAISSSRGPISVADDLLLANGASVATGGGQSNDSKAAARPIVSTPAQAARPITPPHYSGATVVPIVASQSPPGGFRGSHVLAAGGQRDAGNGDDDDDDDNDNTGRTSSWPAGGAASLAMPTAAMIDNSESPLEATEIVGAAGWEVFSNWQRVDAVVQNALSNSVKHVPGDGKGRIVCRLSLADPVLFPAVGKPDEELLRQGTRQMLMLHQRSRRGTLGTASRGSGGSDTFSSVTLGVQRAEDAAVRKVLVVEVLDNGDGIPSQMLQPGRLFQPFQQLRMGDSMLRMSSSGLGLSIVRKIVVEQLGGEVGLASLEGQGTLFFAHLPVWARRKQQMGSPPTPEPEASLTVLNGVSEGTLAVATWSALASPTSTVRADTRATALLEAYSNGSLSGSNSALEMEAGEDSAELGQASSLSARSRAASAHASAVGTPAAAAAATARDLLPAPGQASKPRAVVSGAASTGASSDGSAPSQHTPSPDDRRVRRRARQHGRGNGSSAALATPSPPRQSSSVRSSGRRIRHQQRRDSAAARRLGLAYVVDDERVNRTLMARVLRRWGLEVVEMENGLQLVNALTKLATDSSSESESVEWPLFVTLDMNMPVLNGPGALLKLQELGESGLPERVVASLAQVRIFGIAGNAVSDDVEGMRDLGACAVLTKPVEPAALATKLVDEIPSLELPARAFKTLGGL